MIVACSNAEEMKIKYLQDTDTLYIEFKPARHPFGGPTQVAETRDLDENTALDMDKEGNICAITVEHANERTDIPHFSFEQIAA
jgi:uncharacterized protein YuzE